MTIMTNPATLTGADAPSRLDEDLADKKRAIMTRWARWSISNHAQFTYNEGAERAHMVNSPVGDLPQGCDCSGFVTGLAAWAVAEDPNGLYHLNEERTAIVEPIGERPVGYTGTILEHCNPVTISKVRMGDLIVYGPDTGSHVVYVLERLPNNDFYVASHGQPGDPSRQLHSNLLAYFDDVARPVRWLS